MREVAYLADATGSNCFLLDCRIDKKIIYAVFAFWVPKLQGQLLLSNKWGDRVILEVPKFVWELESHDCLYKAEYPIIEVMYGNANG
jgi:hypothetical protein